MEFTMKDVDHNKKTGAKIKDLFVTEDEYLESKRAQAEELLKDAKNGKKCREDEEKVDGKCKKKKKFGAYSRNGIRFGWRLPDYRNPDEVDNGDADSGTDNTSDTSSSTSGTDGSAGGDGGGAA